MYKKKKTLPARKQYPKHTSGLALLRRDSPDDAARWSIPVFYIRTAAAGFDTVVVQFAAVSLPCK